MAHNAENSANEIEEVLNKWGIRDRIYGAITDRGVSSHWNGIRTGLECNGIEQYGIAKSWDKYLSRIAMLHYRRLYCIALQVTNMIILS